MPSEGEGKFKPIKAYGIGDWLRAGQRSAHSFLSEPKAQELVSRNEGKQERLKKYRLPQFETYGPLDSFEAVSAIIPPEKRTENDRFLVRCAPKSGGLKLRVERTMNIPWSEVGPFIDQLPGGKENYTVEIREHWEPDYGGGLIANGKGTVAVEICLGSHADIEKKGFGDIKAGTIDTEGFQTRSFKYQGDPSEGEKEIMMGSLRYFVPHLTRERLRMLRVHAEWVYKEGKGHRFIDCEDDPFWTNVQNAKLLKRKPEPLSGD